MTILEFMIKAPWLSGFIIFWLGLIGLSLAIAALKLVLKSITIYKHGYPPPHCDIYGDGIGFENVIDGSVN